ncbi:hypothetical protein BH09SUM1_BH09SUM1_30480 [soil metagenome]
MKIPGAAKAGIVVLVLAAGGAGLYYSGVFQKASPGASSSIPSAKAFRADFQKTVNSVGELKAATSSLISAPFEGKVVKLLPEGVAVKSGDPIIWMDTTDLQDKYDEQLAQLGLANKDMESAKEEYRLQELQNEYSLKSGEANVELSEQKLLDAKQKKETEQILVEKKISARSKLDEVQLAELSAEVELRNSRINLEKTKKNLQSNLIVKQTGIDKAQLDIARIQRDVDEFKEKIDSATLRSPTGGELSYLRVWKSGAVSKIAEGDQVWPRLNLMEIPDRSQMIAIVPVNELDVASVEVGQSAEIVLDALPGKKFTGKVERKSIVALDASQQAGRRGGAPTSTSSGPREFEVQVKLDQNDSGFFQGMTASVRIITSHVPNALQVPLESLTMDGEKVGVFKSSGLGAGSFVPVTVIAANDRFAAIEGSVEPDDLIFLRNPKVSADEARVLGYDALRRMNRALNGETTPDAPTPPRKEAGG